VIPKSLDELAPLPEHSESKLHPESTQWYRALVTFEVTILPQPKPDQTDKAGGG
jgi:hypothetical protein